MKNDSSPNVNASAPNAEKKTSVYFKGDTLSEIRATAARLDRSVGWVLAKAYAIAKAELDGMSA
jgi:uncharacterized small protein (TIGR04563 family)